MFPGLLITQDRQNDFVVVLVKHDVVGYIYVLSALLELIVELRAE